jgi:Domain of unknown function (DUF4349)
MGVLRSMVGRRQGVLARAVAVVALSATILAGAGLLAGCSGNGNSASGGSAVRENPAAAGQQGAAAGPQNGAAGSGSSGSGANGSASTGGSSSSSSGTVSDTSDLIIMAALQLGVRDPAQAAAQAEQLVQSAGGYVAAEAEGPGTQALPSANSTADGAESADTGVSPMTLPSATAESGSAQALLLLRVPPARLDTVLSGLSGAGRVSYRTLSETNVTGQVADVASRISSAEDSLAELRSLIGKAASVNDLISLEQALASRESDLESLEAQQRALTDQVRYATVTVGYYVPPGTAVAPAKAPAAHRAAFVAGLVDSWHALGVAFRALLAAVGWLLPFAVLVALLWWPVRWVRRRVRGPGESGGSGDSGAPGARPWWRRGSAHRTQ